MPQNFCGFVKTNEGMRFWTLKNLRIVQSVFWGPAEVVSEVFMAPQITVVFVACGAAGLKFLQ